MIVAAITVRAVLRTGTAPWKLKQSAVKTVERIRETTRFAILIRVEPCRIARVDLPDLQISEPSSLLERLITFGQRTEERPLSLARLRSMILLLKRTIRPLVN